MTRDEYCELVKQYANHMADRFIAQEEKKYHINYKRDEVFRERAHAAYESGAVYGLLHGVLARLSDEEFARETDFFTRFANSYLNTPVEAES